LAPDDGEATKPNATSSKGHLKSARKVKCTR
jgi:hypothetical protein